MNKKILEHVRAHLDDIMCIALGIYTAVLIRRYNLYWVDSFIWLMATGAAISVSYGAGFNRAREIFDRFLEDLKRRQ